MNTQEILKELNYTLNQEKGKTYDTCSTNWRSLLEDVIRKIEELKETNNKLGDMVNDYAKQTKETKESYKSEDSYIFRIKELEKELSNVDQYVQEVAYILINHNIDTDMCDKYTNHFKELQRLADIGKAVEYYNDNGDLKAFCAYHVLGEKYMRIESMLESYGRDVSNECKS